MCYEVCDTHAIRVANGAAEIYRGAELVTVMRVDEALRLFKGMRRQHRENQKRAKELLATAILNTVTGHQPPTVIGPDQCPA